MKLSGNQLERLADRVFRVLKASGHVDFDYTADERIEERALDVILNILEDDARTEDRLSREAERLVTQQSQIAKQSGRSLQDLVDEVKLRLAKSKRVMLDDGPERADNLAERVLKALWKLDGLDFYSEDIKIQNCIARAIFRFRMEDDRIIDAVERLLSKKTAEEPYSQKWCSLFDKYYGEIREKLSGQQAAAPTADVATSG